MRSCNQNLLGELDASPDLTSFFDETLGTDVATHMRSGSSGLRNPPDTAWHHPSGSPDSMILLRQRVHRDPALQPLLHPGPNGSGGFAEFFRGG